MHTVNILIVDDNPVNIDLLQQFLTQKNFSISAATNGSRALSLVDKFPPDIILLDIMMPGMDGYEVCHQLKDKPASQNIPIIFVTAKTDPGEIKKGFAAGAADYISKPIYKDEVLARINNQLHLLEKNKLLRDGLIKARKMHDLGRMVASISHEIASPLSVLKMSLSVLKEELHKLDQMFSRQTLTTEQLQNFLHTSTEAISISERNIENSTQILNSFKLIAVDQCRDSIEQVKLKKYIESVLLSLRPLLKKTRHNIQLDIEPDLELHTRPGALSQIFTNLINNSLLHGFEHMDSGTIHITARQHQQQLILHYADNGCGMDKDHLKKIFHEFFTTKAQQGGSGLGMPVIKHLVEEELNGKVEVESELNQGIDLTITIPL